MIGVNTEADRRYAVSTHVTVLWSVSSSASIRGRTGTVIDCIIANEATAMASKVNDTM